jgi:hypothetical protein
MTTDVGPEIGWFFGDECNPCEGSLPSVDGNLQYGHVPASLDRHAFSFALGVSGLILPYAEGYVQLGRSTSMPYGLGVRVGGIGSSPNGGLRQAHLFGRVDRPLATGRRLLWNPSVFYHSTNSNGQNPGHIWALVNGFGLELSMGFAALTPSFSVVAAHGEHTSSSQPPSSGTKVFGMAALGVAFRRDPYR